MTLALAHGGSPGHTTLLTSALAHRTHFVSRHIVVLCLRETGQSAAPEFACVHVTIELNLIDVSPVASGRAFDEALSK